MPVGNERGISNDRDDDSDDDVAMTDSQMNSWPGDGGHVVTKRAYIEMMEKLQAYEKKEAKRKKRKQKNTEKGADFKRLEDIPIENRVDEDGQERLGRYVREELWPTMKYYQSVFKEDMLKFAYEALGYKLKAEQDRYADHIVWFVDNRLNQHTHNCVGYIKRKVMEGGTDGGK